MTKPPKQLEAIVRVVLAYKPVGKTKPARRRKRRRMKLEMARE